MSQRPDSRLELQLERIEAELRRLGLLKGPVQPAVAVSSAFGMAEMPFEHWLVKVFLPRAYEAAGANSWPARSQVGIAAIRNFDGRDDYNALITLLCEFDRAVEAYSGCADV
ncbi:YqcC family protein [Steroidobacter flavus]|uniref:YqcC family protein n=1 Tax=Steroidobacter flavus TaxID=1842136 RepID=A0ABV8SQL6_9GAMM